MAGRTRHASRRRRRPATSRAATSARGTCASAARGIPITSRCSSSTTTIRASGPTRRVTLEPPPGIYRNAPATGVARVVCYTPEAQPDAGGAAGRPRSPTLLRRLARAVPRARRAARGAPRADRSRTRARSSACRTRIRTARSTRRTSSSRRSRPRPPRAAATTRSTAACCFRTSSAPSRTTAAGCCSRARRRSCFCRTSRATPTSATSRRRRRTPAWRRCRRGELRDLAAALKSLLVRYDNLWQMSFPYVLTLHQAPTDGGDYSRLSFPHRVPPAAAQAAPAEVPRRPGDRRRQLPERHAARSRRRRSCAALPDVHYKAPHALTRARCSQPILDAARSRARRGRRRDRARSTSRRWRRSIATTTGDTIYAIDVVGEAVVDALRRDARARALVRARRRGAAGRTARAIPTGATRRRPTGGSSSIRSTARAA